MKKMPYTIIFIIVLALLVFAGCMKFKGELPGMTAGSVCDEPSVSDNLPSQDALSSQQSEEMISELINEMRGSVDQNGVTVYSEEEISSAEAELREEASALAEAPVPGSTAAAVQPTQQPTQPVQQPAQTPTQAAQPTQPVQQPAQQPTQPAQPQQAGANEYDILRSGRFYCVGSMVDSEGSNPLEIAVTDSSVYMLTKFESVDMGMLVSGGKTYMIYPEKKAYLKLSALLMKMMGMEQEELLKASDMGFSDMEPLSQANAVADGNLNGQACKIYNFSKQDGSKTLVYMNGNKLLGFEAYDASEKLVSGTYVTSITANVPADKINPPADYKEASLTSFMGMLTDVIG